MKKLVIDFDYTVFNTTAMRQAFVDVLVANHDISPEMYHAAERQIVETHGGYLLDAHLAALAVDAEEQAIMMRHCLEVLKGAGQWIYSDVKVALEAARESGVHVTLLSLGDPQWQELKIDASGIAQWCDEVLVTASPKVEQAAVFVGDDIVCVNDKGAEIDEIAGKYPDIQWFWVTRPEAPYIHFIPKTTHVQVSSFSEISAILTA